MAGKRRRKSTATGFGPALLWSYGLSFGKFIITGAVTFVLAAMLDPETFGVMFMAMIWVTFVQMLIHNAALPLMQQQNIEDRHFSAAFWAMLGGSAVVSAIIWFSAPGLAALNSTPQLTQIIHWLAPIVVLEALSAVPDAVLRRNLRFRGLAVRGLIGAVIGATVGLTMAGLGYGVWALVGQQLSTEFAYTALLWLARPWRPRFVALGPPLREMYASSAKSVGGFLGYFVAKRTDALIMGALFGSAAVGLYRLATRLTDMVTDLTSTALNQVSLPDLSTLASDRDKFGQRLGVYAHTQAVFAFPLLGLVTATADPVLEILGDEWTPAALPLRILCLATAVWIVSLMLTTALQAAHRVGVGALFNWLHALVSGITIAVSAFLTGSDSTRTQIVAIASSVLVTEVIIGVLTWWVTYTFVLRTSGRPVLNAITPAFIVGLVIAGAGWGAFLLLPDGTPAIIGGIVAALAGVAAGLPVLLATDRIIVQRIRTIRDRLRNRRAPVSVPDVVEATEAV
jgi:O-antigen/teichoic acid export membrane protein